MVFREFILPLARRAAEIIGVHLLYIFALPYDELIARYQEVYCFQRLDPESEDALHSRVKPSYDERCIFMYQVL